MVATASHNEAHPWEKNRLAIRYRQCSIVKVPQPDSVFAENEIEESGSELFSGLLAKIRSKVFAHASEYMKRQAAREAFDSVSDVVGVTTELFGPHVTVKRDHDPEDVSETFVVFSVTVRDIKDGLKKEQEWTRRVRAISQKWNAFRLDLIVEQ
jgi:hypothetical protein